MKDKHSGTILLFVVILVICFLVYRNFTLLYVALGLGALDLIFPWAGRKIHDAWMKFAEILGSVMSKVILVVVYFVFLVPVAMLSRLFRKSPFQKKGSHVSSYFTNRNFAYTPDSLENVW